MISNKESKKVRIYITTYENEMESRKSREIPSKFICSICLNARSEDKSKCMENRRRKSKSCHLCGSGKNYDENYKIADKQKDKNVDIDTKTVQTSDPDVAQGLNLLNEVLSVFQKNKETKEYNSKTCMFKDAGTCTEANGKIKRKLSISRTFYYSIGEFEKNKSNENFMIIDYNQPDVIKITNNSLDLIRHKSSSIPQMKLEELMNSIKVKAKSKDTIEEVNRMFATVRKNENYNLDDSNRPMTRNGPRVLPVVKTDVSKSDKDKNIEVKNSKCCQTNYHLSSGDSSQCCRKFEETVERTVCCHYKKHRNKRKDIVVCECCKNVKNQVYDVSHRNE